MGAAESERRFRVLILIPVFNDWDALLLLLEQLNEAVAATDWSCCVLLVDDASTEPMPEGIFARDFAALEEVSALSLRRNLGHQRAIAIGLAYAEQRKSADAMLVMDGDGEDSPRDISRLMEKLLQNDSRKVIFAERRRRSESLLFRFYYHTYRLLHFLLTGIPVRVGNFSAIPWPLLRRLVVVSELWNHYSAGVYKSRVPRDSLPTDRAPRLAGHSKMNTVSLVVHGLSALSVHGELIGVRLTAASFAAILVVIFSLGALLLSEPLGGPVVWERSSLVVVVLLVLLSQFALLSISSMFVILHGRAGADFLPARDYVYFVDREVSVWKSAGQTSYGTAGELGGGTK